MKGIYEILTERKWMVMPEFAHGIRKALEQNLNTHSAFVKPEKTCGFVTTVDAMGNVYYPEEYQISEDGKKVRGNWALSVTDEEGNSYQNFPFVSVLTVDGPITRNGGGCSYGSIDHRDMMMRAADHPLCRGHVFLINTPGGSAWAINDYKQAIAYAKSKGQPVIAFIDGLCASAGMYLASQCDERYYMHPKDQIGCIGVMAAFYTEKDGSTNKYTNETYHELYDPESFDKNKEYRDIANDNNAKLLIEELAQLGVEFRADVQAACPNATDDMLHGKVFDAAQVTGSLMDGQSDFFSVIKHTFALSRGEEAPIARTAPSGEEGTEHSSEAQNVSTQNKLDMKEYPLTKAALGVEELVVTEEGSFIQTSLLDANEQALAAKDAAIAEADQKVADAEKALAESEAHAKELEEQLSASQNDTNTANETIASKDDEIKALNEKVANLEAELKATKESLANAEQTIADKEQTIATLTAKPAEQQEEGKTPANNGSGVEAPAEAGADYPQWDGHESMVAFRKRMAEWKSAHAMN
jgi:ClpP class serine protease